MAQILYIDLFFLKEIKRRFSQSNYVTKTFYDVIQIKYGPKTAQN